jgi:hypothetical protein
VEKNNAGDLDINVQRGLEELLRAAQPLMP